MAVYYVGCYHKPFLLSVFMLSVFMQSVYMLSFFMLSVFMLSVFMLSVFMHSVIILIVLAPVGEEKIYVMHALYFKYTSLTQK